MAVVKVTHPGYPHGGTKIELDGREVRSCTGIQLNFPVDGVAEAHVGMVVELDEKGEFRFEGPMDAHLHLHVPEGCTLLDVSTHDGRQWLVTRRSPEEHK